ncbi:HXXEE domain-containing protein [Pelosinus baikalensis]|uniref:HXXEE domain-containing protein n=1 Tax=Pelosinus baikalensis TaxID=2892015 RepID=A0ABS8HZP4_9FIRM|nr:HXXEE domain-containing protein [Pelosinus baikalensis]MCC5468633.1 HXXEE domain-containing protein [Pelosinus baikalensis]
MNFLRKYWHDIGGFVALAVCAYLLLDQQNISEIKMILWLSFVAILIHQFEEYRWPGYFPGIFNIVIFKSTNPERYPLNSQSAMVINILIAYIFYLIPVFFVDKIWLGLAPILMGFFQFFWHGFFANIRAKTIYNPGLFAVLFFHIPIGYWYINYIVSNNLTTQLDWIYGIIYFVIAIYVFIIKGNMWLKNEKSSFKFTNKQLGPYIAK